LHPRAFLNATASSGEADFGFFGRGFWIDQPIAFNKSAKLDGQSLLLQRAG
jgi:hypothetical protein